MGGSNMRGANLSHFGVLVMVSLILGVVGCGDSGKSDVAKFSGAWQNPLNHQKVVLNFSGENKTIVIDGKTLPITIKQYEVDRYTVQVSDPALGEKEWKIFRIWDDNGGTFSLQFERDGKAEELDRVTG
jgi:hypothetical protein